MASRRRRTSTEAPPADAGSRPQAAPAAAPAATPAPIVPLLAFQSRAVRSAARFTWNNWSRQTGKSFAFGLRRLLRAVQTGRLQVLLSAGERQSRELMTKVQQHAQALQIAAEFREDAYFEGTSYKQLELRLPNRGRVIALPANPQTARGFTGDAFLDEFAMHREDREIWAALFPTIMRGDGQLDVASTPKGPSNKFAELRTNESFERSTVTIHDAVADGLPIDIAELRAAFGDDLLWRQEFECEFLDEGLTFLTYEQIAACVDPDAPLPICCAGDDLSEAAAAARRLVSTGPMCLGWDVARSGDLSVMWLARKNDGVLTPALVVAMRGAKYRRQYELFSLLMSNPDVVAAAIDSTGLGGEIAENGQIDFGSWRVDAINFAGSVTVGETTEPVKNRLAGRLRTKVEDRTIRIPDSRDVREHFHAIEKRVTTGGNVRFHADRSPGGHADYFWAAALCVDAAGEQARPWDGTGVVGVRAIRAPTAEAMGHPGVQRELAEPDPMDDPRRRRRAAMAVI